MKPGERVLDRYRLEAVLPAAEGQVRFAATDEATGAQVEVVGPTAQVALRPDAGERFAQAAVAGSGPPAAALSRTVAGRHGTRPLAARPPVGGPVPDSLRLDGDEALHWLAWLGPAAVALGGALGGRLDPADLVLDAHGVVRLAPAGLVPPAHRLGPDPAAPPEGAAGTPGDAALYGLGVILYRATTGAMPDGRPARALRPDLPPALDAVLAGLLSPVPQDRRAALEAVAGLAGPPPALDLPSAADATAAVTAAAGSAAKTAAKTAAQTAAAGSAAVAAPTARIKTTRDAPARAAGKVDLPRHPWVVTVLPGELTGAARRRASALADLPVAEVEHLATAGLPLVLSGHATRSEAQVALDRLSALGLHAALHSGDPPTAPAVAALGAGVLAVAAYVVAALALPFGSVLGPLVLPVIAVALMLGLPLTWLAMRQGSEARRRMALDRARDLRLRATGTAPADPVVAAAAAVRAAHRQLLAAGLPAPVRLDLEGALDELRTELSALDATPEAPGRGAQADKVSALATEIGAAARPPEAGKGAAPPELEADIRRRAAAARAAAAELHRR